MENDSILDSEHGHEQLAFNPESRAYIRETAKWAYFLAIVGFIFIAFMVLIAIGMGTFMGTMMDDIPGIAGSLGGAFFTITYLLLAILYFFPTLYLYRYAVKAKSAIITQNNFEMTEAFGYMKSVFKFWGIFTIVILGFYALMFVVTLFGGIMSAF